MDLGEPGANMSNECFEAIATLFEQLAQALALPRTGCDEILERAGKQRMRRLLELLAVVGLVTENARPAKHIENVHGVISGKGARYIPYGRQKPFQRSRIYLQSSLGSLHTTMGDRAVDLAALNLTGKPLAQLAFRPAQLIRETKARLQEPMIHAAQLADERPPSAGNLSAGETGHAGDHALAGLM
jgi:hypothetical protein